MRSVDVLPGLKAGASTPPDGSAVAPQGPPPFLPALKDGVSRRISMTEEKLDAAITTLINAYNGFALPKLWGSGQHASADGMKWDLYEQNLLAEYHMRYG